MECGDLSPISISLDAEFGRRNSISTRRPFAPARRACIKKQRRSLFSSHQQSWWFTDDNSGATGIGNEIGSRRLIEINVKIDVTFICAEQIIEQSHLVRYECYRIKGDGRIITYRKTVILLIFGQMFPEPTRPRCEWWLLEGIVRTYPESKDFHTIFDIHIVSVIRRGGVATTAISITDRPFGNRDVALHATHFGTWLYVIPFNARS